MVISNNLQDQQILIVEDDPDIADVICTVLRESGYDATAVDCGELALEEINSLSPDLMLLDINLPGMNGIDVLKSVRSHSIVPIIAISGYGRGRDSIIALETGADDYITKPFKPDELVARIKALLRRAGWAPKSSTLLKVNELELDLTKRQVKLRDKEVHLTPIEYDILATLMQNLGTVVTHSELMHSVWGDHYTTDYSVLRVNISRLRNKIEINTRRPQYIVTASRKGYWMPIHRP